MLERVNNLTATNYRLQAEHLEEQRRLLSHYDGRLDQNKRLIDTLIDDIEELHQLRANDAQVHQGQAEWAHGLGLAGFVSAYADNDQLEEENNQLKEENDHLKRAQHILVTDRAAAENKQADLEEEKSSWAVEKAQMMEKMSRMEAEASASNAVIAQLQAENEPHKAAALQSTASLALTKIESWNAQSSNLTAMEQAKLTLRDEVVFEEMASGCRKRRAEERREERASKRQRH